MVRRSWCKVERLSKSGLVPARLEMYPAEATFEFTKQRSSKRLLRGDCSSLAIHRSAAARTCTCGFVIGGQASGLQSVGAGPAVHNHGSRRHYASSPTAAAAVVAAPQAAGRASPGQTATTSVSGNSRPAVLQSRQAQHVLAGGLSGAISKTAVAPLERICTMIMAEGRRYRGATHAAAAAFSEGGPLAFWRGNGAAGRDAACMRLR